jgi:hypothetical protein
VATTVSLKWPHPGGPVAGRIHDEIWPILERYTARVEDPSLRLPDASARVFCFSGVSPRR